MLAPNATAGNCQALGDGRLARFAKSRPALRLSCKMDGDPAPLNTMTSTGERKHLNAR